MQGVQQTNEVGTRGTQPSPRGNVGDGNDFDPVRDAEVPQGFARQGVLDFVRMVHHFRVGVANADLVIHNGGIHVQEHVLVDGCGKDKSAVVSIKRGEVGSTSS